MNTPRLQASLVYGQSEPLIAISESNLRGIIHCKPDGLGFGTKPY
jgi:hypothetical protein